MDSGPEGDSFLSPRMLPGPDDQGDYQWPSFCKPMNSMEMVLSPKAD